MNHLLIFQNFGLPELLIIALVVLLFFGGKKIPELMKGLGKGVKSFKDGVKGVEDEINTNDVKGTINNIKKDITDDGSLNGSANNTHTDSTVNK